MGGTSKQIKVKYSKVYNYWYTLLRISMFFRIKWLFKLVHQKQIGTIYYYYPKGIVKDKIFFNDKRNRK